MNNFYLYLSYRKAEKKVSLNSWQRRASYRIGQDEEGRLEEGDNGGVSGGAWAGNKVLYRR